MQTENLCSRAIRCCHYRALREHLPTSAVKGPSLSAPVGHKIQYNVLNSRLLFSLFLDTLSSILFLPRLKRKNLSFNLPSLGLSLLVKPLSEHLCTKVPFSSLKSRSLSCLSSFARPRAITLTPAKKGVLSPQTPPRLSPH